MKKYFMLALIALMTATTVSAQDDLYFTPKKKMTKEQKEAMRRQRLEETYGTYYCGSNRDVDEYNRRGGFASHYEVMPTDSIGDDVIAFVPGDGTYPDSIAVDSLAPVVRKAKRTYDYDDADDYTYSRRMMAYDGYYAPYWVYSPFLAWRYRYDPFYWNDPWYWGSSWAWNDPWYWHSSWYWSDPWCWHGGYWGMHGPYYPVGAAHRVNAGTMNHGKFSGRRNVSSATRSVSRGVQRESNVIGKLYNTVSKSGNFSGRRGFDNSSSRSYNNSSRSANFNSSRSSYSSGSNFSSGSSHGGGFSGGGSRGGGGNFGGRR